MKLNKTQLIKLAEGLRERLGSYWNISVVEKDDLDNAFDPPCRYVEAVLLGVKIRFCNDGEYHIDQNGEKVVDGTYLGTSVQDCVDTLVQTLAIENEVSLTLPRAV